MKGAMDKPFLLLFVFAIMPASSVCSQESQWGVETELDKQSYVFHEPIWLDVTVTNRTSDTLRTHMLSAANVQLYDAAGDLVVYTGMVFDAAGGLGSLLLRSGEQEYGCFSLNRMFASHGKSSGYRVDLDFFPFIPEGVYTVQVVFEDVVSNVLTFEVVKPGGKEDVVLHLMEDACGALEGHRLNDVEAKDQSSQKYEEIVERFPGSAFAETCHFMFVMDSRERQTALRQGSWDETARTRNLLDKYPNSGDSRGWLRRLTHRMDDSSMVDLLSSVVMDKSGTRAAKFAALMLRRMAKQKAGE